MSIHFIGMMRHEEFERDWKRRVIDVNAYVHVYTDTVAGRMLRSKPDKTRLIPPERLIARQCSSAGFSNPFFLAAVLRGDSGGREYGPQQRAQESTNRRETLVGLR